MSYLGKYQPAEMRQNQASALQAAMDRVTALELERFDVSYRTKYAKPAPEPGMTNAEKRAIEDELISKGAKARKTKSAKTTGQVSADVIWNAGRYAAGARDQQAQEAHALLNASRREKRP